MNAVAAAAIAAGELVCEFTDGYRKSLLAALAGDPPRTEMILVFEAVTPRTAQVLSTQKPGRRAVEVHATGELLHFVQRDGASVRVTTLTGCLRNSRDSCTRFDARHAWHFDSAVHLDPDGSFRRQPSGAAAGTCEPWRMNFS